MPTLWLKARKSAVTRTQTVWLPTSPSSVSQQPFLNQPVFGFIEQGTRGSPRTFLDGQALAGFSLMRGRYVVGLVDSSASR